MVTFDLCRHLGRHFYVIIILPDNLPADTSRSYVHQLCIYARIEVLQQCVI